MPSSEAPASPPESPAAGAGTRSTRAPAPAPALPDDLDGLRAAVLAWFDVERRDLPFRRTRDPYLVLVSEAMAQQTRIDRVGPAWERFVARFPTAGSLAAAPLAEVLRAWAGLGYNRRAISLHRAAKRIIAEHGGRIPDDPAVLVTLPGVGPYTARAVAAIAFGRPVGAVDTNVRRVLTRLVGLDGTDGAGGRAVQALADTLVPVDRPGEWTAALMDLGTRYCRPTPRCESCPASRWCATGRAGGRPRFEGRPRRTRPGTSAPFPSTRRWLRGRIVAALREAPGWRRFEAPLGGHDEAALTTALAGLARDGLVDVDPADPLQARLAGGEPVVDGSGRVRARLQPMAPTDVALPADDPSIFELDLRGLRSRWAEAAARPAISGEEMTGIDRRAQALGMPGERLMEHAGSAVAAAVRALAVDQGRWGDAPVLILCGPGNNGGDGLVAARHLARAGARVVAALVASEARPSTADARRNWDRLSGERGVERVHAPNARDVAMLGSQVNRYGVVVDALLGTGVRGPLRDPIRAAVELVRRARQAGVPIVAVDTPTAVDLSSGDPSDPVVQADLTVTFHRPKTGLLTRRGAAQAGRVLVAPIGIPLEADRG